MTALAYAASGGDPLETLAELDATTLAVLAQLGPIIGRMRAEARFNLAQFLTAADAGMGGTAILKAPSERAKREVPECRYVSEGIAVTGLEFRE